MADTSKKDAGVVVFGNVLREEAYSRSGGTVDAIDSKWVSGFVTCASPMSPKLARPIAALLSLVALPVRFVVLALRYLLAAKHGVIFVPFPAHVDGALAILLGSLFGKR